MCYSLAPNPVVTENNYALDSIQIQTLGDFNLTINNLLENTKYYVRSFATTAAGTSYGSVIEVFTNNDYNIGEIGPSGGIVFYRKQDDSNGWQFLETADSDVSS